VIRRGQVEDELSLILVRSLAGGMVHRLVCITSQVSGCKAKRTGGLVKSYTTQYVAMSPI
jgi:hypothetical protein